MTLAFTEISALPREIDDLAQIAKLEGFGMVQRLIDDYASGSNRFSKPGERLYVALAHDRPIAVGGINVDPYYPSASLGRIRHLYVHPDYRLTGVGRRVMGLIEQHGAKYFDEFQLFTASQPASRFYESLNYSPVQGRWKVSHAKRAAARSL